MGKKHRDTDLDQLREAAEQSAPSDEAAAGGESADSDPAGGDPAGGDPASGELAGMPYTLYFPRRGGFAAADIEYAAPLPRVGDTVEYLDPRGASHWYVVSEVIHTLQGPQTGEPERIQLLRAGIPAVYLARSRRKPGRAT